MNTALINELKAQCILREQRGTTAFDSYMVDRFDTEKFAELIVRECAALCDLYAMPDGTSETAIILASAIRRKFGVEE
jgi:hypothetical protein